MFTAAGNGIFDNDAVLSDRDAKEDCGGWESLHWSLVLPPYDAHVQWNV